MNEDKLVDYLRRVTVDLHDTRRKLREAEERHQEPVALVGMACRYPGSVGSPEELWNLVAARRDAMGPFPTDRGWDLDRLFHPDPDHPGTSYARQGGFLYEAAGFDPDFFGISHREALVMDPQQRLLLEVAWELLERAGIDPQSLKGSRTGVYAGAALPGFGTPHTDSAAEGHLVTGNAPSVLSGRLSYTLGLEGPAVTLDTACSSSLVAIHLASHALRQGECDLALAGGVTVMSQPNVFTEFSRQRGLAADGRCKPFAATADGTAFSEGVGLLLLERLSDARRNGHPVLALVRGSAVNQDGASNGLTAPNGPSQQRVIGQALDNARLTPSDVDAVEAHGTGTRLGDPIEAKALLTVYGQDRPEGRPLWLGSVKSNIGHTQGAAGVAGVIKTVMAMRHGTLPATLHADEPTPHVDWEADAVRLLTEPVAWPRGERPRRAGVSSFGISGTNAHLILEEPPEPEQAVPVRTEPVGATGRRDDTPVPLIPWTLSARGHPALLAQAEALAAHTAARPDLRATDVAFSLARTRSVLEHRAVLLGHTAEELTEGLAALASDTRHPALTRTQGPAGPGETAFLFTGQGSQRVGMGRQLHRTYGAYASAFDDVCALLDPLLGHPLRGLVLGGGEGPEHPENLHRTEFSQPALFAVEVALFRLAESFGLTPDWLTGHSVGEIVAAHVAGVLSLPDACTLVAARGRLMQALPAGGAMVAVEAAEAHVLPLLARAGDRVSLAAVNGPASVVVSGDEDAVEEVVRPLREQGHRTKRLRVSHAFHSPRMDAMLDDFRQVAHSIRYEPPRIPVVSNVTGTLAEAAVLTDPDHWVRHVREPVRFLDGIRALRAEGVTCYVELGPDPVLTAMAEACLTGEEEPPASGAPLLTAVLREGHDEPRTLLTALAATHVHGGTVDFAAALPADARRVTLPTYRFQRRRYWRPVPESAGTAAGLRASGHPLVTAVVDQADGGLLLTGSLSPRRHGWLADHAIADSVPLPGTAFLELALAAAKAADLTVVDDLTLETPLLLPATGAVDAQITVAPPDPHDGRRRITIHSRHAAARDTDRHTQDEDGPGADAAYDTEDAAPVWQRHASGTLTEPEDTASGGTAEAGAEAWPPEGAVAIDGEELYEALAEQGYRYGPAFRGVRTAWRHGDTMFADVRLAPEQHDEADAYALHPALLDSALHAVDELYRGQQGAYGTVRLPFSFRGVRVHAPGRTGLRVRITPDGQDTIALALTDDTGMPVADIGSLGLRVVSAERWRSSQAPAADTTTRFLHRLDWQPLPLPSPSQERPGTGESVAVLGPDAYGWSHGPDVVLTPTEVHPNLAALREAMTDGPEGQQAPDLLVVPLLEALGTGYDGTGSDPDLDSGGLGRATPERTRATADGLLRLLQEWLADERFATGRLVVVTRNAVATGPQDPPSDLVTAPAWGLVRAAQAEHPGRVVLVDLDAEDSSHRALRTAVRAAGAAGETECAIRAGEALVPRLVRATVDHTAEPPALDPEGTVLITGGTGALGRVVARHLITEHGARHLLLAGRAGDTAEGSAELAAGLGELGARVSFARCDISDAASLADLLRAIPDEHPLTAVVHAAGIVDDGLISSLTPERLAAVMAAKTTGAWLLHEATRDCDLAAFVLYSSAASVLGNAGQGNYAAANMFLNALAEHRCAEGLPATSLAWGMWETPGGMAGQLAEADRARITRSGIAALTPEQGLLLLDSALAARLPTVVPVRLDRAVLRALADAGSLPAVLRGTVGPRARHTAGPNATTSLRDRLAGLPEAERDRALLAVVREQIATVLAHPDPDTLDLTRPFLDLGVDSLTALELRNRLNTATDLTLPATLVFDHPTPQALARFLHTTLDDGRPRPGRAGSGGVVATAAVGAAGTVTGIAPDEPLAVVGMACRYPGGVTSPEDLWRLVSSGVDAVGEFPTKRGWGLADLFDPDPDSTGRSYAREGGFLHDADLFDAGFFGISPREALAMDPQQRLLLETAWQTFENAGLRPVDLRGSRTGVITGVMYDDYGSRFLGRAPKDVEGRLMPGSTPSVASGRVSYTFGLEGPAVTVDTACSSSLVAMHLAGQALRQGECDLALAGGVTVMATPNTFVEFSRQRGLAVDGRCKPFSAAADGTGWGEGVGLVLLERLSDARRNGHRVLAVVRGSAINQDGASNGLTAPNGPSQERVIGQALVRAGLSASDVDVVEAHGTGTTLGDPIEAGALLATYGQGRPEGRPLWLGSVKSNIGHTQAAAGVAGVIKMVMAMRHGVLPASLHIDEPSPHVDWESGAVSLLTEPVEWPENDDRPRRAGVSSFGFSGTNAHVILEQPPREPAGAGEPEQPQNEPSQDVVPWVVSARSDEAVRGQAGALAEWVDADSGLTPVGVGWSLATARSVFERRAVVLGDRREGLVAGVRALAAGDAHPDVVTVPDGLVQGGGTVFLFSGQGSQRVGMGAGLYGRFPVFAAAFDEVCGYLDGELEHPLRQVVFTGVPGHEGLLDHTTYAQAGLFALQVALARLLESAGVRPDAVVGHSVGEIAAAYVAGVFDLRDACRLVAARATLMGALPRGGAMTAIEASAAELEEDLAGCGGRVSVAAVNTPTSTVISGPAQDVARLGALWAGRGRRTKALTVSHAFHSMLMEPMLQEFTEAVADLDCQRPVLPLISNLTGLPAGEEITTPAYWAHHIRQPVLFAPAVTHLASDTGTFLELGPDPVLTTATQHTLQHHHTLHHTQRATDERPAPLVLSALIHRQPEVHALTRALAQLHTHGTDIDWAGWFPTDPAPHTVQLPTYAFQRERFWLEDVDSAGGDPEGLGLVSSGHPLLGAAVELAGGDTLVLTGRITAGHGGWLGDHRILGSVLVPGAALVEWALRAADEAGCAGVDELALQAPLVLPPTGGVNVQVVVGGAEDDGRRDVRVYSRPDRESSSAEGQWLCHAEGFLSPERTGRDEGITGQWPPFGAEALDVEGFYERAETAGYGYGPAFQGLRAVWRDGDDLLAEVELPDTAGEVGGFEIHPALLDAALHPVFLLGDSGEGQVWMPFSWSGVALHALGAGMIRVRLSPLGARLDQGVRLTVTDPTGAPVLTADSVAMRAANVDQIRTAGTYALDGLYSVEWTALPTSADSPSDVEWAVLGPEKTGSADVRSADVRSFEDVDALVSAINAGASVPPLVLIEVHPGDDDSPDEALATTTRVLGLLRVWLAEPGLVGVRLVVVTRGAVVVDG
ncbi:type I polyketide synthase, partial [Streptomyces sp. NPDC087844]|uniref:type I polyketide synthase n=1 Tax=Streptomyces sp. NPDC087844 TaxID=3365805 RepID=UPI00381AC5AA